MNCKHNDVQDTEYVTDECGVCFKMIVDEVAFEIHVTAIFNYDV
jgi:hypothetical protein